MTNPQPADALMPEYIVATYGRRAAAWGIDNLVVAGGFIVFQIVQLVLIFAGASTGSTGFTSFLIFASGAAYIAALFGYVSLKGTVRGTVGMRVMRTRVIDIRTLAPIGRGRGIGRAFVFGLTSYVFGWLSPLFDSTGQMRAWHDKVFHTVVIDARYGMGALEWQAENVAHRPASRPAPMESPTATTRPPRPQVAPVPMPGHGSSRPVPMESPNAITRPPRPNGYAAAPEVPAVSAVAAPAPAQAAPTFVPASAPAAAPMVEDAPQAPNYAPPDPPVTNDEPAETSVPVLEAPAPDPGVPDESDDDDGQTVVVTRAPEPEPTIALTWDDGAVSTVRNGSVVGRKPSGDSCELITVADETKSLSKNHMRVGFDGQTWTVTDLHSTNGIGLRRGGDPLTMMTAGEATEVLPGDTLVMGDRTCTLAEPT